VPAGSGGFSADTASTVLPANSVVQFVSGEISGNFSSCDSAQVAFDMPAASPIAAHWSPVGNVTGEGPDSTQATTLDESGAGVLNAACFSGDGSPPSYSFNIEFTVLPPPTPYS
jgi:hypothetical protein